MTTPTGAPGEDFTPRRRARALHCPVGGRARLVTSALTFLLTASVASAAPPAADWPQWAGAERNQHAGAASAMAPWKKGEGPAIAWKIALGGGFSSLSAVGDTLYTMFSDDRSEFVAALDAADGKVRWKVRTGGVWQDDKGGNGPRSTPTVARDLLIALGAEGKLVALERATGKERWSRHLVEDFGGKAPYFGYSESPLVSHGKVFAMPGGEDGGLVALSLKDGTTRWRVKGDHKASYSSPVAVSLHGEPHVVYYTRTHLVGVHCGSGEVRWSHPWRGDSIGFNASTPVRVGDDGFFVTTTTKAGSVLVRVDRKGDRYAVQEVWSAKEMETGMSTAVVHGDHLYGFHRDRLAAVSLATGEPAWELEGLGRGTVLLAGDQLVVLSEECEVQIGAVSPTGFEATASYAALESRCWTSPVLTGGRLYVRDEAELVALDVSRAR